MNCLTGAEPQKEGEGNTTQDLAPSHDLAPGPAHTPEITVPNAVGPVRDPGRPLAMILEGIREMVILRNRSPVQSQGQDHREATNEGIILKAAVHGLNISYSERCRQS